MCVRTHMHAKQQRPETDATVLGSFVCVGVGFGGRKRLADVCINRYGMCVCVCVCDKGTTSGYFFARRCMRLVWYAGGNA